MRRIAASSPRKAKGPPKPGRITSITDFAKYLDLSVWTVSRAINGHADVKDTTRRRILAAMEEVGYRPNPMARGLVGGRTGMIGVCPIGFTNPILNTKIFHLQEFLRQRDLRVVLEMGLQDPKNEMRVIEDFARIRVDGIVLMYSTLPSATVADLVEGMACVQVDPHEPQRMPNISIDRRKAMRLLLEHLLRLQHRSFALLFGKSDPWRWPALAEAAKDHGLDPARAFRFAKPANADDPIEAGQLMAEAVLKWPDRPTVMMAQDDQMALGAIQALRYAGVEVPRHMSVTGFDNLTFARKLHPTLTTIDQNPAGLMERAGELLLEEIARAPVKRGGSITETVVPELIVGESTGPARENFAARNP